MTEEYVLGTGKDELERLGIQHRVWAMDTEASWKRGGILKGSKVLDIGSGPGHASIDLAKLVGPEGQVLAVDESAPFVDYIRRQAKELNYPKLHAEKNDIHELDALGLKNFDAAYCRWVLCWLPDPKKALTRIRSVLKPRGRLIIHDYFNWRAMTDAPRTPAVEKMVTAAVASFVDRKGDVDIVARLPQLLRESGYKIVHFDIHQKIARGGGQDPTLEWPLTWWRTYGPKLVELGKLAAEDYRQAAWALDLLEGDPDRFFFCPPLFEIIAERV